ncbi:MAG TPA: hypothetical protein VGO93_27110 [Candidatus Xenobia bacterium]
MEYMVKIHPGASALIRTWRIAEALNMAKTCARFLHRPAYIYSPWSKMHYEVKP